MFPEGRLLEFLIVGAVALMVVGPKDLPILMRKVAQFMAKVRGLAAEFRASFDELARQSELDELRKQVEALRSARPETFVENAARDAGVPNVMHDLRSELGAAHADFNAAVAAEQAARAPAPEAAPSFPDAQLLAHEPLATDAEPETPAKPKRIRKPKADTGASTPETPAS